MNKHCQWTSAMGDSWDDDDFEVPVFPTDSTSTPGVNVAATTWDDEEEEEVVVKRDTDDRNTIKKPKQLAAEKAKELKDKLQAETDRVNARLQAMAVVEENETPEERKLRLQRQVEESDNALADELFSSGGAADGGTENEKKGPAAKPLTWEEKMEQGVEGLDIKTLEQSIYFSALVGRKMKGLPRQTLLGFLQHLSKGLSEGLRTDDMSSLISSLNVVKNEKVQAAKPKKKATAKKKKATAMVSRSMPGEDDGFGGGNYDYDDGADDFM